MVTSGVSTALQYDAQGHLIKKGAQSFTFDRSDLLLGLPGLETYRYDAEGRRAVIDSNGQQRLAIYDHAGRLLVDLEPGLAAGCNPANDRVFCNSFEKPPATVAQTRYVYLGRHLIGKDSIDGLRYLHTDALGSLVAETDANKAVTQRYHYLPYGAAFGTMPDGPGYAGNVMDPSGLTYMQARYYDPQLGQFLSTDPVDPDPQTGTNFNRYAYGDSNPYRFIDPSGRYSCDGSDTDCGAVANAVSSLSDAASNSSLSTDQQDSLMAVHDLYGTPGEDNGVTIKLGDEGGVSNSLGGTSTNSGETTIGIRIDQIADGAGGRGSQKFQDRLTGIVAHEGEHAVDQRVNGMPRDRITEKAGEIRASTVQAALFQGLNSNYGVWLWTPDGGLQANGIERSAESSANLWCQSPGANCK
jgi:RHS repeat-associated protein